MNRFGLQLVTASLIFFLSACTDRTPQSLPVVVNDLPASVLTVVGDVQYDGQQTSVLQMQMKGSSLYLTGRPFGFAKWDVGADPENPHLSFAAATQIDRFFPRWVVDWWTSGALTLWGQFALMSGTYGASLVDLADINRPREAARFPGYNPSSNAQQSDEAFVWSAVVAHPSQPIFYAFRKEDFLFTLRGSGTAQSPTLSFIRKDAYGQVGESVCCVNGATFFDNKVFVAFRQKLMLFEVGSDAMLTNPKETTALRAVNIASSNNLIYIQHEPLVSDASNPQVWPRGIYVFDKQGQHVAYLDQAPLIYAVSPDDRYLYANMDDTAVRIFRINWQ